MGANNAYGSGIPIALSFGGADSKTITPTAGVQDHKCELRGLPLKEREHNLVAMRIVVEADLSINQPASGASAIAYDKLPKAIASVALWLPEVGYYFSHDHTTGPIQININNVIANGYRRRSIQDVAVPTTDAVHARTLRLELPFALPILTDEMDTAFPMALLEGGRLEVKIAENTVFDSDSTGAKLDTVVLRAWVEAIPVSKMWVPGLYGFRTYSTGGGVSNFRIEGIGRPIDRTGRLWPGGFVHDPKPYGLRAWRFHHCRQYQFSQRSGPGHSRSKPPVSVVRNVRASN